jgi:NACalpha-BTF3-like transcription factor
VADIVSTCIVLHNLCIITKDKFDSIWIEEVEVELKKLVDDGTVKGGQVLRGERASIDEVKAQILKFDVRGTIQNYEIEETNEEVEFFLIKQDEKDIDLLREATMAHESIAKALWEYNLSKESIIQFSDSSSDSDAMEE